MNTDTHSSNSFLGHPKGLFVLFFTEMWERFSFYGMRAILVLYIYSSIDNNGLGWSEKDAIWLYGWYTMFVYVMSIPGGLIADKVLGAKKSVMIGAVMLCVGHWIMAIPNIYAFFTALVVIVMGVGMLKPNISTMVGGLYKELDGRREQGFTIFYIGINVGALLASLLVGLVAHKFGWHYGFGLAGFGMMLGMVFYVLGQKHLKYVGNHFKKKKNKVDKIVVSDEISNFFSDLMENNLALLFTLIGVSISGFVFVDSNPFLGILILILVLSVAYFIIIHGKLNMIERNRVKVLAVIFLLIIVYNAGFEQTGGFLNIYTDKKIDRLFFGMEIPTALFQGINSLFIILLAGSVGSIWMWLRKKGKESSAIFKMVIGLIILSFAFVMMGGANYQASLIPFGKANMAWIFGFYFLATVGELCVQPVALSFITRLAPKQYASIMMGVFFAVTGLGNKFAASVGESAHPDHMHVHLDEEHHDFNLIPKQVLDRDSTFTLNSNIYIDEEAELVLNTYEEGEDITHIITIDSSNEVLIKNFLKDVHADAKHKYHASLMFHKNNDYKNSKENVKGDGLNYEAELEIEEVESKFQYEVFIFLFILIILFGLIVLLFLRRLKKLTHGAEDIKEPKDIEDRTHGEILE